MKWGGWVKGWEEALREVAGIFLGCRVTHVQRRPCPTGHHTRCLYEVVGKIKEAVWRRVESTRVLAEEETSLVNGEVFDRSPMDVKKTAGLRVGVHAAWRRRKRTP